MKRLSKQITLGIDPYTGKRIRKRVYGTGKTALQQAEKNATTEYARTGQIRDILFMNYREKWFDAYCTNLSENTRYCYQVMLKHLDQLNGIKMSRITRLDLQKVLNEQWDKPYTCKKIYGLMRQIWKSAVFDGAVEKDITQGLKRPKMDSAKRRALTEKEMEAVRTVSLPEQQRFMVDLLLQFGLRPGEALALNVHDFDKRARTLTISKSVSYKNMREAAIKTTKTGVTRILPVPDSFWSKIPKISGLYYFATDDGVLFCRGTAQKFCNDIIRAINAELGGTDKLKATDITLYSFRHNKASLLYYTEGISLKKKAQYMGHSEEQFIRTYSHLIESREETEILREAVV